MVNNPMPIAQRENLLNRSVNPVPSIPSPAITSSPTKTIRTTKKTSTGTYTSKDALQPLVDAMVASSSSAAEAEAAAMREANRFNERMQRTAMEFNERQADLAYQRSITAAEKANQFSRSERLASQQWYENMSNTAYQRAMADMKKAGLNPILAYAQGGASSAMSSGSSGAMANAVSASVSPVSATKANMASAKATDKKMKESDLIHQQYLYSKQTAVINGLFGLIGSAIKAAVSLI